MSEIKYTIIIDDSKLIKSFQDHEKLADETSNKISKSYDKASSSLDKSSDSANRLSNAINKINSAISLTSNLSSSFDELQKVISFATPIMENYGIAFSDLLKPLEIFGIKSRVTANNLIELNNALINFKLNPTKEGFRDIEVALISTVKQFNGFQSEIVRLGLSFRDISNEFSHYISVSKQIYSEIFGLNNIINISSTTILNYINNLKKITSSNSELANSFNDTKEKLNLFTQNFVKHISEAINIKGIYDQIKVSINKLEQSFNSLMQMFSLITKKFDEIKSKFLEIFSSMEKNTNFGETISNIVIISFDSALKILKLYFELWANNIFNTLIYLFVVSPTVIGIGIALATSILSGFFFTWQDIVTSGKFIGIVSNSFSQTFLSIFGLLITNIKASFANFQNVYIQYSTSTFMQIQKIMSALLFKIFNPETAKIISLFASGYIIQLNRELTAIISSPLYLFQLIKNKIENLAANYGNASTLLRPIFNDLKNTWDSDIKSINKILNSFKYNISDTFNFIKNFSVNAFNSIDFSPIINGFKKVLEPTLKAILFFIPRITQDFFSLIGTVRSFNDAVIMSGDILIRLFASDTIQSTIKFLVTSFNYLKINANSALNTIAEFANMIPGLLPKSVIEFYNLIKSVKSFDDAINISKQIFKSVFDNSISIIKNLSFNFTELSKVIYSDVLIAFKEIRSLISSSIPNSVKEVYLLVRSMQNIDEIGSVAVKSFNIIYKAMSDSISKTMPIVISNFKRFYDMGKLGFESLLLSMSKYTDAIKTLGIQTFTIISDVIKQFAGMISLTPQFINLLQQMFPIISKVYNGVAGLGVGTANWSGILSVLIPALAQFNLGMGQSIALSLTMAGIIGGALSFAFSHLVIGIGKAISYVSNFFVELGISASESYVKIKSTFDILTAVINGVSNATGQAGYNFLDFNVRVAQMAIKWNLSMTDIAKGTQELVLVGSQLGLTANQVHNLTEVVAQYAKINKDTVYDAAVAFGSALNGNSQSVLKYGVKLSEANNQHYLFKMGLEKIFSKMSDNEKVQTRYNNILKQFSVVAGVADIASGTLADQANALKSRIELLSAKFGEGSYIIENTNIFAFALNKTLSLLSDNVAYVGGILTSLFGRLGQVLGAFLQLSIKIFLTIKAFTLLRVLIESKFWADFALKTIPLIGISFQNLVNTLAKSEVKLNTFRGLLSGFAKIGLNEIKSAFVNVGIVVGTNITFIGILTGAFNKLMTSILSLSRFMMPFMLIFGRMAGWIAIVVAVIYTLYKSFQYLEDQTKVFSTIWTILVNEFSRTSEIVKAIVNVFSSAFSSIGTIFDKVFGFIIYTLSVTIQSFVSLAKLLGSKFISAESLKQLTDLERRLDDLGINLINTGFSLMDFKKSAVDAASSLPTLVDKTKILEDILSLTTDLANAGKTQLQILQDTHKKRLDLINLGLTNEVISMQRFTNLKKSIESDYHAKRAEEVKTQLQNYNQIIEKIRKDGADQEFARLQDENNKNITEMVRAHSEGLINDKQFRQSLIDQALYFDRESKKLQIGYQTTWEDISKAIMKEFENIGVTAIDIGKTVKQGLVDVIANSFNWLGKSLAEHSHKWEDLQKNIGQILAGMATMFGNFFITLGMAMLATGPITGWTISGSQAIAAGMGLHILAGALGTMGGEQASSSTSANSGGVVSTPDVNSIVQKPDQQTKQEPKTVLNININGDVLDSDQTGMRIVKLINEAYDKKGVVLRGNYA